MNVYAIVLASLKAEKYPPGFRVIQIAGSWYVEETDTWTLVSPTFDSRNKAENYLSKERWRATKRASRP